MERQVRMGVIECGLFESDWGQTTRPQRGRTNSSRWVNSVCHLERLSCGPKTLMKALLDLILRPGAPCLLPSYFLPTSFRCQAKRLRSSDHGQSCNLGAGTIFLVFSCLHTCTERAAAAGTVGKRPTLLQTIQNNVEHFQKEYWNEGDFDFLHQDLGNNASRELVGESFVKTVPRVR